MPSGGFVGVTHSPPKQLTVRYSADLDLIIADLGVTNVAMTPRQWALLIDAVNEVTPVLA